MYRCSVRALAVAPLCLGLVRALTVVLSVWSLVKATRLPLLIRAADAFHLHSEECLKIGGSATARTSSLPATFMEQKHHRTGGKNTTPVVNLHLTKIGLVSTGILSPVLLPLDKSLNNLYYQCLKA